MDEYRAANQRLWDEYALVNSQSKMYDMPGFLEGRGGLHDLEIEEVGPVQGKTMLHLQCHFGMDSLSWARLGAQVTAVDFSAKAIQLACGLSQQINVPARFIQSDIYALPEQLDEQFDIVFTSYGVLTWLSDLRGWAQLVSRYVKPGGMFYIAEFHPTAMLFDDMGSSPQLHYPYWSDGAIVCDVQGSYADPQADVKEKKSYEWAYPLGDVVTHLIEAGLRIEFLHEQPYTVYNMFPYLVEGADGLYRLPPGVPVFPLQFSLKALKDI
ncbi:MAG TPA: class I SAM-dependent methyltransferase [Anaerolineaceae bacterium]|nr:class I SAM-dependent methyltransferase [Anaerolineaceae bacterium]